MKLQYLLLVASCVVVSAASSTSERAKSAASAGRSTLARLHKLGKSFDLLTDDNEDEPLVSSGSSTLDELKKIGASMGDDNATDTGGSSSSSSVSVSVQSNTQVAEKGVFVPFGKDVPAAPGVKHYTSTGRQECIVCDHILKKRKVAGAMFHTLTFGLPEEYQEMAKAQQEVLQACPEFMNNWCYEDLGGTQTLRSPCPSYLTCHYCLGLNPLHCLPE